MKKLLKSRVASMAAFLLVMLAIILSIVLDRSWKDNLWTLTDEFFAFMMTFCWVISTFVEKFNKGAAAKLELSAAIAGCLMIVALIVEYFMMN